MSETDRRTPRPLLDDAYPYALDALDPQQRRAIDDELAAADPERAREFLAAVSRIRETMAALTVSDSVPPPARLEAALMRALDRLDPQVRPLTRRDTQGKGWRLRWLTAAAAAVVAVGIGTGVAVVIDRTNDGTGAITAQQVLDQPDSRESSVAITGGGAMTVHQSTALGAAAVSFQDMPALPADRAYQLWRIPTGGAPRSVAVMEGPASVVTAVDAADTLAVTVEPAGGSAGPTTPVIVSMTVG
ncbi:anti-sigma factor domain-containing protein [Nocardia sp. NPDC087230]|uniref:anti-sigma factor n=1 Tax=Nocardia sp. NPDC087230 TaxID=3364331 RepID=UPI0038209269